MIFVTVGTHEQPFNRLVEYMDKWARFHDEKVVIQTGYCTYEPQYCTWRKFYSYDDMLRNTEAARIVITHGGPSSFIMPLQIGKTPIVVPRKHKFNEHLNDHQIAFSVAVANRMGTIVVVEDEEKLGETIEKYDGIVSGMRTGINSNNARFNVELRKIVDEMFK